MAAAAGLGCHKLVSSMEGAQRTEIEDDYSFSRIHEFLAKIGVKKGFLKRC
jgi:hypothetical protein